MFERDRERREKKNTAHTQNSISDTRNSYGTPFRLERYNLHAFRHAHQTWYTLLTLDLAHKKKLVTVVDWHFFLNSNFGKYTHKHTRVIEWHLFKLTVLQSCDYLVKID